MARLSRKLGICKWAGAIGCLIVATAFVFGAWWELYYTSGAGRDSHYFWLYQGRVFIGWGDCPSEKLGPGWALLPSAFHLGMLLDGSMWVPGIYYSTDAWSASLPCSFPFLLLFIPTLLLWRHEWRAEHRPGFCPCCDYNLTGNTTGRCPECGTPCDRGELQ